MTWIFFVIRKTPCVPPTFTWQVYIEHDRAVIETPSSMWYYEHKMWYYEHKIAKVGSKDLEHKREILSSSTTLAFLPHFLFITVGGRRMADSDSTKSMIGLREFPLAISAADLEFLRRWTRHGVCRKTWGQETGHADKCGNLLFGQVNKYRIHQKNIKCHQFCKQP